MNISDYLPKISIITVVLNDKNLLIKTIKSVTSQDYSNLEHIIIDGGSFDGTIKFIEKLKSDKFKWTSEPDMGIYDAMNKGLKLSDGEWVIFLNAGDCFASNTIVSEVFKNIDARKDLIYGNTLFISDKKEELIEAKEPETLWRALNFNHNSLFTKRELLEEHPFNLEYKIVADSEFVIWAYKQSKSFFNTKILINKYNRGGYSDINSVMRTVERWKLVSDMQMKPQSQINDYYFQRLLWEKSCQKYLLKTYNVKI